MERYGAKDGPSGLSIGGSKVRGLDGTHVSAQGSESAANCPAHTGCRKNIQVGAVADRYQRAPILPLVPRLVPLPSNTLTEIQDKPTSCIGASHALEQAKPLR